jgi:hypothetical protein
MSNKVRRKMYLKDRQEEKKANNNKLFKQRICEGKKIFFRFSQVPFSFFIHVLHLESNKLS